MQRYIGLDLGQASEFTACAVVEAPVGDGADPVYALRYLDRFALGTPFKRIVENMGRMVAKLPAQEDYPTLVIDQTSVGRPIVELFRRASMRANIRVICITAGQQTSTLDDGTRLVPKIEVVSCLQVLLQCRRLQVAQGLPAAKNLARELQNFRMKVALPNNDAMAAWRENKHDDLVFAVALACWMAEREPPWGPDACSTGSWHLVDEPPPCVSDTEESPEDW